MRRYRLAARLPTMDACANEERDAILFGAMFLRPPRLPSRSAKGAEVSEIAKGYFCKTCDKWHEFSAYVYAHSFVRLMHKCDDCGAEHKILNCKAKQIKRGKVGRKRGAA